MLFKTLESFKNPVIHDLIYPKTIRGLQELEYEERQLKRPFIGDQLDEDLKLWNPDRAVVIAAPTGSGKTTFTVEKIVKKAVRAGENVLVVTNRNPLNLGYKKDVAIATGLGDCYTIKGLQYEKKFGTIWVVNYQGLKSLICKNETIKFSYVVLDESHYFLQDSLFSGCTASVLKMVVKKFRDSTRLYISATIDEVLPFITKAEMDSKETWKERYSGFLRNDLPLIYRMDENYDKINLYFYENIELLLEYLASLDTQTLAFCGTINECKEVANKFKTGGVIYSEYLKEHPEKLEELIEKEGFAEDCLATTSVFSNGNNISKKTVRSVLVTLLDPVEIMQMTGRRRLDIKDENDFFNLYLPIPTLTQLEKEIKHIEAFEKMIKYYKANQLQLKFLMLEETDVAKQFRKICEVDKKTGDYTINQFTDDKIYLKLRHLEYIHALISGGGRKAYCDYIAGNFGKIFQDDMIFASLEDRKKMFMKFILSFDEEMSEDEFEVFKVEFMKKRIKLFGKLSSDNSSRKRKPQGIKAINNRLAELDIGVYFEEVGKNYRRVNKGECEEYEENYLKT